MSIIKPVMVFSLFLMGGGNAETVIAEMYLCDNKGAQNFITSRPDLYDNCRTLKDGRPYAPKHSDRSFSPPQRGELAGLSSRELTAYSPNNNTANLSVFDRAAIYCTQVAMRGEPQTGNCGQEQAEGISFLNDLLADSDLSTQQKANIKVAIRSCLTSHSYGAAVDYAGTKNCIESFTASNK